LRLNLEGALNFEKIYETALVALRDNSSHDLREIVELFSFGLRIYFAKASRKALFLEDFLLKARTRRRKPQWLTPPLAFYLAESKKLSITHKLLVIS